MCLTIPGSYCCPSRARMIPCCPSCNSWHGTTLGQNCLLYCPEGWLRVVSQTPSVSHQERTSYPCCLSGSSWNGSIWAQNRLLHCLEGCPRMLMSLTILKSFCLPMKSSHGACVALQAAAGMGVFGPRTVYCIALKDAPGCHEFLLQDDGKWVHVKETTEIGQ